MSVPLKGFSNHVGTVASGVYKNAGGVVLDLSGNGVDLSNTAVVKVAPFDNNKNSFYALLDLSNNFVNNVDCSGANIIRVLNGSVLPVGYVANHGSVNAFVCDTSGNLWVGGHEMEVKINNSSNTVVSKAENMFIVPRIGTVQPTAFNNVDLSGGCNDICPVEDLMFASVVDVSGKCLNYSSTPNVLQVGSVVFPRIRANTGAFDMYFSPQSGGPELENKYMDLSGHRLVAFSRVGNYGNDVSGFYVVRSNSSGNTAATDTLGDASGTTNIGNINYTLELNKIAYDSDRNKLYVIRNDIDKHPIVLPLDVSAGAYTSDYTVTADALLKYAKATSSTSGVVDSSGFMIVCPDPIPNSSPNQVEIKLDSSGTEFATLTLLDVSGVLAMDTVVAPYGGSNYNYLFLVDASRNVVDLLDSSKNVKAKIAELWLTSRSNNTGDYSDGSGISFIHGGNSSFNYDLSGAYIRDLRVDACGNVFLGGHQIFIQNNPTIQSANIQSMANLNVMSSASLAVATNNNPLLGNDLPYDSSVALTNEKEPSEKITSFINNRDPNCSVDKIIKSRV